MITATLTIHETMPGHTQIYFKASPGAASAREIDMANKIHEAIARVMAEEARAGNTVFGVQRDNPRR